MALSKVKCEGYKAFKNTIELHLRPITVIFGKNNTGKTTLTRLPLFVMASLGAPGFYRLNWNGLQFGNSFQELANVNQPHPDMWIEATTDDDLSFGVRLQHITTFDKPDEVRVSELIVNGESLEPGKIREAVDTAGRAILRFYPAKLDSSQANISEILSRAVHVPSGRSRIESTYVTRKARSLSVDDVPYMLATDSVLEHLVDRWFSNNLDGTRVAIDRAAFAFRLITSGASGDVPLAQSGRGTQSALPVVTLLHASIIQTPKPSLLIIEEPEEHLHPSAHPALADLVIKAAESTKVVVETHSENFILRIRRRISEGSFSPSDLALYYVNEAHQLVDLMVDTTGFVADWPVGIFESDVEEAQAIVEARMAAIHDLGGTVAHSDE